MAFRKTIVKQELVIHSIDFGNFPTKIVGKTTYQLPSGGQVHFSGDIEMDLTSADYYLHPEHSIITNIRTQDQDIIEVIVHNGCREVTHEVEVPRYILENRGNLSWFSWNTLETISETLRAAEDSGKKAIAETFEFDDINISIMRKLVENCDSEHKGVLWEALESGRIVAVDYNHNCLIDLKHRSRAQLSGALNFFEGLDDWGNIVAANQGH